MAPFYIFCYTLTISYLISYFRGNLGTMKTWDTVNNYEPKRIQYETVNGIPMVTLIVHNKNKILVSKKKRPMANPYDIR